MNLTDLSEVLRDRAELDDSSHEARMAGVRARVSATRRRRAVAGVAFVVLTLVGAVYAVLPRVGPPPEPAVPTRSLPEYRYGTRLLAQAWGDLPSTSATIRFVPKSVDLTLFTQCDIEQNKRLLVDVTVNGRSMYDENRTCGSVTSTTWSSFGVVPGQPSVITLTVAGEQGESESWPPPLLPLPASGTFAVGIGEAVQVSDYPSPPRPQTLEKLSENRHGVAIELRADPVEPAAKKEITVEWPGSNLMLVQMNTPGRLRVLVNDIVVTDLSHWAYNVHQTQVDRYDWETGINGLQLSKGQLVKITVIPERTTGDWNVTFSP
ncbi:hypothetical protein C8D87_10124 [Lentzea atacamensis]|uniref:Uncharacterized protein n=1 Tax=Lentzea atacamensis TaxID=531938 RepID=A0ABX9EEV9_9PSEU|nr:hypothetical protein [Lentzea atacamensis]RAS69725.1 hypothetical protein C8D87_10124 [Lentzea atacamensis]